MEGGGGIGVTLQIGRGKQHSTIYLIALTHQNSKRQRLGKRWDKFIHLPQSSHNQEFHEVQLL